MLDYARPVPGELADRVVVTVTFLRLNHRPAGLNTVLPAGFTLNVEICDVARYRTLYDNVGARWLWWLRRMMPDAQLASHLASPAVRVMVLRHGGEMAGFFETEASGWPDVNLNYFGLMPGMIGHGLGARVLDAAIAGVFDGTPGLRGMTVNTCTADHPKALPNYLAAGFSEIRRAREVWDIPRRLGLSVPDHLRG